MSTYQLVPTLVASAMIGGLGSEFATSTDGKRERGHVKGTLRERLSIGMCISFAIMSCFYMQRADREFHIVGTANNSIDAYIFGHSGHFTTVSMGQGLCGCFCGPCPFCCLFRCFCFTAIRISGRGTCVSLCFLVVLFWFDVDCHYACDQQCPCIFYLPLIPIGRTEP